MSGNISMKRIVKLIEEFKQYWPDFKIKPEELIQPSVESVIKFYKRFLDEVGINIDNIITLFIQNRHYNLHEQCMDMHILYLCVYRICKQLGFTKDFSLSFLNFIEPSTDTNFLLRVILIVDYLYYAKLMSPTVISMSKTFVDEIFQTDFIQKTNSRNEELAITEAKNIDTIEILKYKKEELKKSISASQLASEELNKKIQRLEAELELEEKKKVKLTGIIEKKKKIKARIEPKIINDVVELAEELEKEKNDFNRAIEEESRIKGLVEAKMAIDEQLDETMSLLKTFLARMRMDKIVIIYNLLDQIAIEKEKELTDIRAFKNIVDNAQKLNDALNYELTALERKAELKRSNEKIFDANKGLANKLEELDNEYRAIITEYTKAVAEVAHVNYGLNNITAKCSEYEKLIEEQKKFHDEMSFKYEKVRNEFEQKYEDTMNAWQKIKILEQSRKETNTAEEQS